MLFHLLSVSPLFAADQEVNFFAAESDSFNLAGFQAALDDHRFSQRGLDIKIETVASESLAIERVVSNNSAVGLISAIAFLQARAKGVPIVAFAAGYLETPVLFCVPESSKVRQPSDFVGKRVGYGPAHDEKIVYDVMATKLRLPKSQITTTELLKGSTPFSIELIDVWPVKFGEPLAILHESGIRFRMIKPADFGVHILGTVYFSNQLALRSEHEFHISFVQGLIDGWEGVYRAPSKPAFDSNDRRKALYSDATFKFMLDQRRSYLQPFGLRIGEFSKQDWQATQNHLISIQVLSQPLDISELADFAIVREAYRKRSTR